MYKQTIKIAYYLLALASVLVAYYYYSNSIYLHFSRGGYVLDSGWYAYLFASVDPMLKNPQVIADCSFYNFHISPYFFLWGSLFTGVFGLTGIESFAIHNGVAAVLPIITLMILSCHLKMSFIQRIFVVVATFVFVLCSEYMMRAIGYPHFEILFVGYLGLLYVALLTDKKYLSLALTLVLITFREDGGLYAAYTILCAFLSGYRPIKLNSQEVKLFCLGIIGSIVPLLIKFIYFTRFNVFKANFSGNKFDHLSWSFFTDRLSHLLFIDTAFTFLLISICLLAIFRRWQYLLPLVLLQPLILLYLIAKRDTLGHFELYYGIPFAVITLLTIINICYDLSKSVNKIQKVILFSLSAVILLGTTFFKDEYSTDLWTQGWHWDKNATKDITTYQNTIKKYKNDYPQELCASIGVVALAPDSFSGKQFVNKDLPDRCKVVMLFEGDLDYLVLIEKIAIRKDLEFVKTIGKIVIYQSSAAAL